MNKQQLRKLEAALKKVQREQAATPEQARTLMRKLGIMTKSGKLTRGYTREKTAA